MIGHSLGRMGGQRCRAWGDKGAVYGGTKVPCISHNAVPGSVTNDRACKYNVALSSLFWLRDVFWPQHPRCWDQNTSQIQISRQFEKKRGVVKFLRLTGCDTEGPRSSNKCVGEKRGEIGSGGEGELVGEEVEEGCERDAVQEDEPEYRRGIGACVSKGHYRAPPRPQ